MIEKFKDLDWILIGGIFILAIASLTSLASTDIDFFWRQLTWFILAFIFIFLGSQINWRSLISQDWFRLGVYFLSVLFLLISNFQSGTVRGTKAWLSFGDFNFEPSELAKLALIFVLANFFSKRYLGAWLSKNIIVSLIYAFIPVLLVAIQPDLGSAFVILSIWLGFLLLGGVNYKRLIIGFLLVILIFGILWSFYLKSYQKERFLGFFSPTSDPLGVNYNVIQSKIAIGSAGLLGKGFKAGTQTQLHFLPEAQTDFLFAAFVEEWGILGGVVILLTFLIVVLRILNIGLRARTNDFKFIALGTSLILVVHFLINMGSNLGFLPVAGLPFPFLSYGGSSLLTLAALMGIIQYIKIESR